MPTFATPEPITVKLATAGVQVRIATTERPDTVVTVQPINSAIESDVKVAERTKVDFSNGTLSIETSKSGERTGSAAIAVELPVGSRLLINTVWTDVHANGRFGDCELHVASGGKFQLDHVGSLKASLTAGDVIVGRVAGTAVIENSSAALWLGEIEGAVRYRASSGTIRIGHALAAVDLSTSSGGIEVDRADGDVVAKAANCPIRIGRLTRGTAELENSSGGIEVGVSEYTSAVVDAESTKGTVRNSLPVQDAGQSGDSVKIHARNRHGDIVLRRALD
ncbi:DUF4097 family beta strand repeat-containing protein [Kutzneria viridogrisea]|uniref:DUF4097 domain-containing protein n=2 Tax=Kutzneria TaxID=43356 RepID=W5WCE5_9PSEU|nr:DUF4097 family beta strand repeat-containing protein [Kutzneria albida]AHH98833.1 hypothetical protein KALB_5471 [Kutzneria albida DSM 43870]MBA8923646.1 DUF4097 and DUF4098 domain-containing protein YvlB [Kutzneria viridogrisea]